MPDRERTEKVRQEVMRLNELLGIMRRKLADGELAYAALFAGIPPAESAAMHHKDLQWKLAEQMDDLSPLKEIVSKLRFEARELEKAFAELYDIVAMTPDEMD